MLNVIAALNGFLPMRIATDGGVRSWLSPLLVFVATLDPRRFHFRVVDFWMLLFRRGVVAAYALVASACVLQTPSIAYLAGIALSFPSSLAVRVPAAIRRLTFRLD